MLCVYLFTAQEPFLLGPSGSLGWVLALSSTEPAGVSQMNCSYSALSEGSRGEQGIGLALPSRSSGAVLKVPLQTHPSLRHTSLASPDRTGVWRRGLSTELAEERKEVFLGEAA